MPCAGRCHDKSPVTRSFQKIRTTAYAGFARLSENLVVRSGNRRAGFASLASSALAASAPLVISSAQSCRAIEQPALRACFFRPLTDFTCPEKCLRVCVMAKWIGAAALAVTLMLNGSGVIDSATAAPRQAAVQNHGWKAPDLSAGHRTRHYARYGYRTYYRPYYPA